MRAIVRRQSVQHLITLVRYLDNHIRIQRISLLYPFFCDILKNIDKDSRCTYYGRNK